ncbi:helicase-exonuclease AddAB subunit AddB [Macrococcus caseolyticus]|uniref:helicase-exonuclease AddAB subunit AddB n=1 Tax=Macrococcoides caseolyticum TaxID=69966 RepID=UPI0024BC821D|nr:helicase-exonuclease AddAB subunit AddB [Macrococcus caseolyticus]MDJ1155739.1 helicase-exonuclease AddAB subunit AddB [Macrococcus caseolyticus]
MTVQLLLGRRGTGKTHEIIERIKAQLKGQPLGDPIIMIAPRQSTFQIEQALSHDAMIKGSMRTAIYSFDRLFWRLESEEGSTELQHISNSGVEMLTYQILNEHKDELKRFQSTSAYFGFSQKMAAVISELKKYNVTPSDVYTLLGKEMDVRTKDKLHDIYEVYTALEEKMSGQYMQTEDMLVALCKMTETSKTIRNADIYIDGFYNFTTVEYMVIQSLAQHAKSLTIALTIDQTDPVLFRKTTETLNHIKTYLHERALTYHVDNMHVSYRFNDELNMLENSFSREVSISHTEHIHLSQHASVPAEAAHIAHKIMDLVRKGERFKDIVVLYRDESYVKQLIDVCRKHQIPYHTDYKELMIHHKAIELIRSLLDAFKTNMRIEHLFRALKTGLIAHEFKREEDLLLIDMLENVMIERGMYYDDLIHKRKLFYDEKDVYEQDQWDALLQYIDYLLSVIEPFKEGIVNAQSGRAFASAIYSFMLSISLPEYLMQHKDMAKDNGEQYIALTFDQILTGLNQVLDDFVLIMDEVTLDYKVMCDIIDVGFLALEYNAPPQGLDQIQILNLDLAKVENKKYVFVCGVNDDILPRPMKEDALITDQEKRMMQEIGDIQLAPTTDVLIQDEWFVFYNAVTHAQHSVYISYSLMNMNQEAMRPSRYLARLERQLHLEVQDMTHDLNPEDCITTYHAGIKHAVSHIEDDTWSDVVAVYETDPQFEHVFKLRHYRNQSEMLAEHEVSRLYGDTIKASVSRFETFNQCAFKHFANHGLRLKERLPYQFQSFQLGNIFHDALRHLSEKFKDQVLQVDTAVIASEIDDYLKASLPSVHYEVLYSKHYYQYIVKQIRTILLLTFTAIQRQTKYSNFKMARFETKFGKGGALDTQIYRFGKNKKIEITGQIDRIDILPSPEKDYVRIIDYKSRQTDLDLKQVYYGLQMQMLTYMDVVLSNTARLGLKSDVIPAGMLYFHVYNPKLSFNVKQGAAQLFDERFNKYSMQGFILDDIEIAKDMDTTLEAGQKSKIVPAMLKNDGSFNKRSSRTLALEEMHALLQHNKQQFMHTAQNILQGDSRINPVRYDKLNPCLHCAFKSVCHIDPILNQEDIRTFDKDIDPLDEIMKAVNKDAMDS